MDEETKFFFCDILKNFKMKKTKTTKGKIFWEKQNDTIVQNKWTNKISPREEHKSSNLNIAKVCELEISSDKKLENEKDSKEICIMEKSKGRNC